MAKVYKTFSGHGVDVAEHRADDLDRLCLERVRSLPNPKVLDLGCGAGGQSVRLAQAGASVLAVDKHDFSEQFAKHISEYPQLQSHLHFVRSELTDWLETAPSPVDCVLFQRTIHYLPYWEAVNVLEKLSAVTTDSLYISVTAMHSAVGDGYAGKEVSIRERFFALNAAQVERFLIAQSVCLYTREEFVALLEKTGWKIEQIWESAFGNVKAVCHVNV